MRFFFVDICKMKGRIILENIRIYSNHGCLEEEKKIGSDYIVNLTVDTDLNISSKTDLLADTVDYVHLNRIIKEEMALRSELLEHVAQRILDRIDTELPTVEKATLKVSKVNPPIGGDVDLVTIVLEFIR